MENESEYIEAFFFVNCSDEFIETTNATIIEETMKEEHCTTFYTCLN